jgi:ATP-dependent helicase/nuclease subunit B
MHATERPSYRGTDLDLQRWEPATERTEVRTAARRVRELLADGVQPADIGIVVADRATYRGPLGEVLPAYNIPFTFANKIGIEQTLVGDALLSLLEIADGTDGGLAIQALAGNQLADIAEFGISASTIEQIGAQTDADATEALLTALEDADGDHDETISGITELQETLTAPDTLPALLDAIGGVLETFDMETAVTAYQQADAAPGSHRPAYESSAWNAVTRVIESFERGPAITTADPPGRLRQALLAELVSGPRQRSNYVRVLPLAETAMESFEHLFVLGLTAGYVPTESDTMAFFGAINDADEEFSRAHTGLRARYLFGTLVSGSNQVVLSTPRHTVGGTEHTTAPIVAELERYVSFEDDSDIEVPRVESEDIQRDYAAWASRESFESPAPATEALATAPGLAETTARFAQQGVTASWRRSQGGLTAHEAQLEDVFEAVFSREAVAPFSPSALEDYARCPFLYLTKRVLGFEEEYDDDAEIDRGDRGIYIHDVLATFYRDLRTGADEPVDIDTFDRETLERRLLAAAKTHLAELEPIESLFAKRTIARLLAGLGEPDANPYYSGYIASTGETATERGLFVRFLDEETEAATNRQLQPTHFEAAINLDFDGTELLRDSPVPIPTPDGTVNVHGIADRLDTHPTEDAFSVVDYKTGSVPSKIDVKRGTKLQLPLYGLAFESVLDSTAGTSPEAVAGSYYELSDPSSVDADATFVSSREAQYDGDTPLVAGGGRPLFDTRAEFSRFIRDVTATRLGRIATSIDDGFFEPTLLDENHANCEQCSFKHVCDVRNHHRRETIDTIDDGTHYVSERARDVDLDLGAYSGGDD